jgi:hypothetical protein
VRPSNSSISCAVFHHATHASSSATNASYRNAGASGSADRLPASRGPSVTRGSPANSIVFAAPLSASIEPFKNGAYPGRSSTRTANTAHAAATVVDRKSLPRSTRTTCGSPPAGPYGSSVLIAVRNAARIDSRLGTPGVTATPVITFVAQSMNHVTHGLTNRPSTSTSTDAST